MYEAEVVSAGRPGYGALWRALRAGAAAAAAGITAVSKEEIAAMTGSGGSVPGPGPAPAPAPGRFGEAEVSADDGHLQLAGVRLEGPDLAVVAAEGSAACRAACGAEARCAQWTFSPAGGACRLKPEFGSVQMDEESEDAAGVSVSGALLDRFWCRNGTARQTLAGVP